MVLSTCDRGEPCSAPLFYLPGPEMELYWFSSPSSRHSLNLRRDPHASVVIFHPSEVWNEIRGVQFRGTAAKVTDRQLRARIATRYAQRFKLPPALRTKIARMSLYVFRPAWMRCLDNRRGFAFRRERTLARP